MKKYQAYLIPCLVIGIIAIFSFYWFTSGFELIKSTGLFSEFILEHTTGNKTIFSWNALIFAMFYLSIVYYPIIIVPLLFLLFFFNFKFILHLLTKKNVLYFLFLPLLLILFVLFLFIGRIIVSLIILILFLGYPIYLIVEWIYENIKK